MRRIKAGNGIVLLGLAAVMTGCVGLGTYRELQEKYEHVIDAKLELDREYTDARRQLFGVEEQHAKFAGQIDALRETVEGQIRAATGPLAADVAKLMAERGAVQRDRLRDEQAAQERMRLAQERVERLAQDLDRLADRMTRAEVWLSKARAAGSSAKKTAANVEPPSAEEVSGRKKTASAAKLEESPGRNGAVEEMPAGKPVVPPPPPLNGVTGAKPGVQRGVGGGGLR